MSLNGLPVTSSRMLRVPVPTEVHRPEKSVSISTNSTDTTLAALVDMETFVSKVRDRLGLSNKQLAALMNLDPSQWSKQLKARDKQQASLNKMWDLPLSFWLEFAFALCEQLGIPAGHPDLRQAQIARAAELLGELARLASIEQTLRRA